MSPKGPAATLAIGMLVTLTACGSVATASPTVAGSPATPTAAGRAPTPPASPSGAPTPSIDPSLRVTTTYPYPAGTTIQVVADAVRVRRDAGLDGEVAGRLGQGARATVVGGPVDADSFTWYEIQDPVASGWVATGDAEDRWIVAVPGMAGSELVFRLSAACDVTPPLVAPAITVTTDRTVVIGSGLDDGGWRAGRLTEHAFSEFTALLDRPALAQSGEYRPERRPDAGEPPGHGLCVYRFTLGPPEDRIEVTSVSWFGDEEETAYYLPSPERRDLDALARRMLSDGDLFSGSAWEVAPTDYRAESYLVWLGTQSGEAATGALPVEELLVLGDWRRFGEPIGSDRCGYLDRDRFARLADAFASSSSPASETGISYLNVSAQGGWLWFVTSPMTPDGYPTCGDIPAVSSR